ncbi:hypothetical protein [Nocardia yamanashiensis]|uniref:hypothetical protein n=1 Tax=Nocardia yamanashiensis TaxID=209247 RepID=UPI001470EE44|nr:hypothetical protein [Nocardia yamanashiensis]
MLATAAILTATAGTASAEIVLTDAAATDSKDKADEDVMTAVTGSAGGGSVQSAGSSGGLASTGSTGTGSFGLPNLDKLIFGDFKNLCMALGSAVPISGEASFGCNSMNVKPGDAIPGTGTKK